MDSKSNLGDTEAEYSGKSGTFLSLMLGEAAL